MLQKCVIDEVLISGWCVGKYIKYDIELSGWYKVNILKITFTGLLIQCK